MSFQVLSGSSETSISISSLVDGKSGGGLTLPGVGAVQRMSLLAGETGEIVRLNHHVTFVRGGETRLFSRHGEESLGTTTARPGSIHLRPAMVPHVSRWDSPVDVTVVSLEVRYMRDHASDLFRRDLKDLSLQPMIAREDPFLWQLGRRLDQIVSMAGPTVFVEQIMATMAMHLTLTANSISAGHPARALSRAALTRTTDYIEANLATDIRLASLAAMSNLSVYHFSRQFSREMGIGVGRYIQLRRMRRASDLLRQEDLAIPDVAEAVGYQDPSSFSRSFRDVYGVSPDRYRREASGLVHRKRCTKPQ